MNRVLSAPAPNRSVLVALVEHAWFRGTIIALIVLSAILLGLETVRELPAAVLDGLEQINRFILAVFVAELVLRIAAHRRAFFRDAWSLFDLAIVAAALASPPNTVQVLRSLRIVRVLRLVSAVPSLRRIVDGLLAAVPGIASIAVLLVLLLYVSAVMATQLFRDVSPELFGHLGVSLFTLFQIMTLEGWPDIAREVMAQEPWAWIFFAGYILVATYMVLNLVIGVVVSAIQSRIDSETQSANETKLANDLAELKREIAALHAALRERG